MMAIYRLVCPLRRLDTYLTTSRSLYIYDRHCTCVYYHAWQRTQSLRPGSTVLPGTLRQEATAAAAVPPSQRFSQVSSGIVVAQTSSNTMEAGPSKGLPFDEEAKLVYGVVFSLRNMVKRLSGKCVALSLARMRFT